VNNDAKETVKAVKTSEAQETKKTLLRCLFYEKRTSL